MTWKYIKHTFCRSRQESVQKRSMRNVLVISFIVYIRLRRTVWFKYFVSVLSLWLEKTATVKEWKKYVDYLYINICFWRTSNCEKFSLNWMIKIAKLYTLLGIVSWNQIFVNYLIGKQFITFNGKLHFNITNLISIQDGIIAINIFLQSTL